MRVALLVVCDSSCCEVEYSALNRTRTAARSRLQVSTLRDILTKHFLGDEIKKIKTQHIFDTCTELPFAKASNNAQGRQLKEMMRGVLSDVAPGSFLLRPFFFLFLCHCALHSKPSPKAISKPTRATAIPSALFECRMPSPACFSHRGLKPPALPAGCVLLGNLLR